MDSNRREFIVRSTLAVAAGALGPSAVRSAARRRAAPPTVPVFASLRRNVGTFTARGGTMGWMVGPDAVVVIDSQFADTSKMFLDGFKPMTGGRKIDLLINTHHHPDHTGGNKVLQPSVVKIVAQENAPGLQRKQAAAQKSEDQQAYADTTYKTDWKVDLGSEIVSAHHYGPGHTGGDGVIFFQRANVVHMGDLMSHQRHPRVDRPAGASIRNWLVSLEKVVKDHNADTDLHLRSLEGGRAGDRTERRSARVARLLHARCSTTCRRASRRGSRPTRSSRPACRSSRPMKGSPSCRWPTTSSSAKRN